MPHALKTLAGSLALTGCLSGSGTVASLPANPSIHAIEVPPIRLNPGAADSVIRAELNQILVSVVPWCPSRVPEKETVPGQQAGALIGCLIFGMANGA